MTERAVEADHASRFQGARHDAEDVADADERHLVRRPGHEQNGRRGAAGRAQGPVKPLDRLGVGASPAGLVGEGRRRAASAASRAVAKAVDHANTAASPSTRRARRRRRPSSPAWGGHGAPGAPISGSGRGAVGSRPGQKVASTPVPSCEVDACRTRRRKPVDGAQSSARACRRWSDRRAGLAAMSAMPGPRSRVRMSTPAPFVLERPGVRITRPPAGVLAGCCGQASVTTRAMRLTSSGEKSIELGQAGRRSGGLRRRTLSSLISRWRVPISIGRSSTCVPSPTRDLMSNSFERRLAPPRPRPRPCRRCCSRRSAPAAMSAMPGPLSSKVRRRPAPDALCDDLERHPPPPP